MKSSVFFLAILVIVAAFLRFYRLPSQVEFLGDQGRDVRIIRDLLAGNLVFIGPQTSIGNMYLGPWFYYFMAPSLALFNLDPLGPAAFTAFLGVVTVIVLYFFVKDIFKSTLAASISALLFALSPVVIRYSTFSWNPNIMPLFSLLFFWFLLKSFISQKPVFLLGASLSFVMCFSSHYLSLILLPIALVVFGLAYVKNRSYLASPQFIKYLLVSVLIFILSLAPLVMFDLKHSGQNLGAISRFFSERETTVNLKIYKGLYKFPQIISQVSTSLLGAGNTHVGLLALIVSLLLSLSTHLSRRVKLSFESLSLLAYLAVSLLFLGLYKQHVYDHYFGFIFPFIFVFISLPLARLLSDPRLGLRLLSLSIIAALSLNFILNSPAFSPPKNQLARSRQVAQFISTQAGSTPFNLALIAKQNYDSPYRYFLEISGSPVVPITEFKTDQLFVICEPWGLETCSPVNHPFYDIAAFGWSKIDSTWQVEGVTIFRLVPNPEGVPQST